MAIETVPGRVAVLVVCNIPLIIGFGSIFFSSWGEFFKSFIPGFDISFWSWVLDWHTYATWENNKLYLFLILVAVALYGEYRFFWPSPPAPAPIQIISSLARDRPNPSFNSDPAVTGCVLKQFPWVLRSLGVLAAGWAG
jgi:hypothetical protein